MCFREARALLKVLDILELFFNNFEHQNEFLCGSLPTEFKVKSVFTSGYVGGIQVCYVLGKLELLHSSWSF